MTDTLIIITLALVVFILLILLFRKSDGDTKSAETLRLLGDMISQNQKNTDEYQSKKREK